MIDYSRPLELPPRSDVQYVAGVDPSGGRHDHFCICVGHKEGAGDGSFFVADVVRGVAPPFDPANVIASFVELCREYRINQVTGDNYSAEFVSSAFTKHGIKYVRCEMNRSQCYLEMLPLFMRQNLSIPNHPKLLRELRLLERRTSRMGKDIVDHGLQGSDDYCNALAVSLQCMASRIDLSCAWVDGDLGETRTPTAVNCMVRRCSRVT